MQRGKTGERAMRSSSPKLTPATAAKIKALLKETDWNHAQIASNLGGINQGRVSEVKTGKRFPEVEPCSLAEAMRP